MLNSTTKCLFTTRCSAEYDCQTVSH